MSRRLASICVTYCYNDSPAHIFDAWLDPDCAGRWLFATASRPMTHVEIDARVGGSFCFADRRDGENVQHCGEYLRIVPHRRITFTLSLNDRPDAITCVEVTISPSPPGCELRLIHTGVPSALADYMEGRWTGILYGLGETLDCRVATFDHHQE